MRIQSEFAIYEPVVHILQLSSSFVKWRRGEHSDAAATQWSPAHLKKKGQNSLTLACKNVILLFALWNNRSRGVNALVTSVLARELRRPGAPVGFFHARIR
jgi:hypothetical protein